MGPTCPINPNEANQIGPTVMIKFHREPNKIKKIVARINHTASKFAEPNRNRSNYIWRNSTEHFHNKTGPAKYTQTSVSNANELYPLADLRV